MNERNTWIDIITKLYKNLHLSERVMHTSSETDKKRDRILKYFERLERVQNKVVESKSTSALAKLKEFYYDLYVIKPENIPDKYFENEQRIMRERGYGNLTKEEKNKLITDIIEDQKKSLEPWIDYFLFDEEAMSYEMWEKYWVFQGLQILGNFDKETLKFSKRDKTTVYPFPPVNREAIFTTIHLMEEYIKDKNGDNEIKAALGSGNFKTLYEYSIKQISKRDKKNNPNTTQGKWVKYDQGSDYKILRNSLQGYYTGWCTAAGESFAKSQLAGGDFYIYYTLDENNEPKVPRIAIRMQGHNIIREIRGIDYNQSMELEMMPILNEKLEEFPDRDKYYKKEYDMQRLTSIDNKVQKGIELTREDLRFLYEIDNKIDGFGYKKDPRIKEIKSKRNEKKDYAFIYDCKEEEIGFTIEELKQRNIKVFVGDLSNLTNVKDLKLPKIISGNLDLRDLKSAEGLTLPDVINGNLYLDSLESAKGLKLPKKINGSIYLKNLNSAKDLNLPKTIGGSLYLDSLESAKDLDLPEKINGGIYLRKLTSAKGLKLPDIINGNLYLDSLESAKGLTLPKTLNGNLYLKCLERAKDLKLPKTIGGSLYLDSLESAEDLALPEIIGGSLYLDNLTNSKGLILPKKICAGLYLRSLTNVKDLKLSETIIDGNLDLRSLENAEGLELPKNIVGYLNLESLTSAKGLTLPDAIGGHLFLNSLTNAKNIILPRTIYGNLYLNSLISTAGLTLPEIIGGGLYLDNLEKIEGLQLPQDLIFLKCNDVIINEIIANPEKYYRQPLIEESEVEIRKNTRHR